jgi:hypothetical protein
MSEFEVLFPKSGTYEFYCPIGKVRGKVTVLAKAVLKKEEKSEISERSLASMAKQHYWTPRDE